MFLLIIWRVDGKVKEIKRTLTSERKNIIFDYNAMGQRIAKHVYDNQTGLLEKSTYYILDAQGNQMSMYEHNVGDTSATFTLEERNIYGSSRLGTLKESVNMFNPEPLPSYGVLGNRGYELTNHLGNVLAVVSDNYFAIGDGGGSHVLEYRAGLNQIYDYSPFGVPLKGRVVEKTHQECTTITTTDVVTALEEGFTTWFTWTGLGDGLVTYVSGEMQISNPSTSAKNIGASRQFAVGEGLHTVTFDIIDNTCATIVLWPPSSTPKTINVYIRDNSNNIVASGAYTTAGSYTLTFTPSTSGTYKIEFYMAGASALCWFRVDNVLIQYTDEVTTTICNEIAEGYRYQFNGMEVDNEVKGNGNSYTTEFRQYDPRLGRWLSIDPLFQNFPWQSPYVAYDNNPILLVDPLGLAAENGNDGEPDKLTNSTGEIIGTPTDPVQIDEVTITANRPPELNVNAQIQERKERLLNQAISNLTIDNYKSCSNCLNKSTTGNNVAGFTDAAGNITSSYEAVQTLRGKSIPSGMEGINRGLTIIEVLNILEEGSNALNDYGNTGKTENLKKVATNTGIFIFETTVVDRALTSGIPWAVGAAGLYYIGKTILTTPPRNTKLVPSILTEEEKVKQYNDNLRVGNVGNTVP